MNQDSRNRALEQLVSAVYLKSEFEGAIYEAVKELDPDLHETLKRDPAEAYAEIQNRVS